MKTQWTSAGLRVSATSSRGNKRHECRTVFSEMYKWSLLSIYQAFKRCFAFTVRVAGSEPRAYMDDGAFDELLCIQLGLGERVEPFSVPRCGVYRLSDEVAPNLPSKPVGARICTAGVIGCLQLQKATLKNRLGPSCQDTSERIFVKVTSFWASEGF